MSGRSSQESPKSPPPAVVSIGTFDGVHRGHQALISRSRAIADAAPAHAARVVALVFDPNPLESLRPELAPARLSHFSQREGWLRASGADEVVRLEPTPEVLGLSPEEFVRRTVERFHPIAFVEGDDFHFGRGRAGDNRVLAQLGSRFGFTVEVVPTVQVALSDQQLVPARSTVVRWLLGHGRARDAAVVLSRPHELIGTVVHGDRRGRVIGFPTANVATTTMVPGDGVYAGLAHLPDGSTLPAALSVGTKPTFDGSARTVEAHLLRTDAGVEHAHWSPLPSVPEYGWPVRIQIIAWVREQVRFASLQLLKEQLSRDCARVAEIVEHSRTPRADHRPHAKQLLPGTA